MEDFFCFFDLECSNSEGDFSTGVDFVELGGLCLDFGLVLEIVLAVRDVVVAPGESFEDWDIWDGSIV